MGGNREACKGTVAGGLQRHGGFFRNREACKGTGAGGLQRHEGSFRNREACKGTVAGGLPKFRPSIPIIARVVELKEGRQLMLNRGIHPVIEDSSMTTAALVLQLGFSSSYVVST